jgi:DNA-binding MarR family transcriptional regulator
MNPHLAILEKARAIGAIRTHFQQFPEHSRAAGIGVGVSRGAVKNWLIQNRPEKMRQADIAKATGASVYTVSKALDDLIAAEKLEIEILKGKGCGLLYRWRG